MKKGFWRQKPFLDHAVPGALADELGPLSGRGGARLRVLVSALQLPGCLQEEEATPANSWRAEQWAVSRDGAV